MKSIVLKYKGLGCRDSYFSYVLMYGFYCVAMAMASALISVYIMDKGYAANQVSFVVSMSFLVSAIWQPFIGKMQDSYDVKVVNICLLLIGAAGSIGIMMAETIGAIAVLYSLVMMMVYSVNPIIERIATRSRHSYGKVRMWGTIGYSCGAQLAGLVYQHISPEALYFSCAIAFALSVIGLMGTVEIVPETEKTAEKQGMTGAEKDSENLYQSLLKNRFFVMYLWITAIYYGVTNVINTYCASMFQNDGIPVDIVSTILLIACFCEIPLVLFSHKFMNRISNQMLLIIAGGMVVVQTLVYWVSVPLVCKTIITFLTKHPSGMIVIMANLKIINTIVTEKQQIAALALVFAVRNLASVLAHAAAGEVLVAYTYSVLFFWGFLIMCVGTVIILCFRVPDGNDRRLFH